MTSSRGAGLQRLIPLPLVIAAGPVALGLLYGEDLTPSKARRYWTDLVHQAKTPSRDWPALDAVCGEKCKGCSSGETSGGEDGSSFWSPWQLPTATTAGQALDTWFGVMKPYQPLQ